MAFATSPDALVVGLSPSGLESAAVGPQVQRMTQEVIALAADAHPVDLAALEAHRSGARYTLEALNVGKAIAVLTQLSEQARPQHRSSAWQGAKELMIGVALKEFLDAHSVFLQFALQPMKQGDEREGELALGGNDCRRGFPS